jgi:hypothetical protein
MHSCNRPRVLLLSLLFALVALAPVFAGTAPAVPQGTATVQAPAAADFLASLATDLAGTSGIPGAIAASGCTSSSQCPSGQLCCLACGYAGCETFACFKPMNGHCPRFP